jgi:hypothetical protein
MKHSKKGVGFLAKFFENLFYLTETWNWLLTGNVRFEDFMQAEVCHPSTWAEAAPSDSISISFLPPLLLPGLHLPRSGASAPWRTQLSARNEKDKARDGIPVSPLKK